MNGCGTSGKNILLMDDANVPSLLSIPYINYTSPHDPDGQLYRNTRDFILSRGNPWFFESGDQRGIGMALSCGCIVIHRYCAPSPSCLVMYRLLWLQEVRTRDRSEFGICHS